MFDLDLILASAHHIAVFSLVAIFAAEFTLVRPGLSGDRLHQLARLDAAYGAAAGLVILVGIVRVIFGAMGWEYYVSNLAFWAKMAAFLVAGLLTIPPTLAFRRWASANVDPGPSPAEIGTVRRYIYLQACVLLLIPIFAAAMARGYGG